jgi:hypothetical protein
MEKSNLDMYRDINDETLQIASIHHPELLVALVQDDSLKPFTRADVLMYLTENARFEYYALIISCMHSNHTLIREIAIRYILNYAKYECFNNEIVNKLNNLLNREINPVIQVLIKESINEIVRLTDLKVVIEDKINLCLDGKCIHPLTNLLSYNLVLSNLPNIIEKYHDTLIQKYPNYYGFEYVLIQNGQEKYYRLEATKTIKGE